MPTALASSAAARAVRCASSGSKLVASANGTGNTSGEAMDHVGGEQQRDLQRGLLKLLVPTHIGAVEDACQAPGACSGQLAFGGGPQVDRIGRRRGIGLLRRA